MELESFLTKKSKNELETLNRLFREGKMSKDSLDKQTKIIMKRAIKTMERKADPMVKFLEEKAMEKKEMMKAKRKEEREEKKISRNFSKMLDKAQRKAEKPEREKKKRAEKMGKELMKTLNPKRKSRFVKGSQEAKDYMASIRKMKK